jgi:hypothetical protein
VGDQVRSTRLYLVARVEVSYRSGSSLPNCFRSF